MITTVRGLLDRLRAGGTAGDGGESDVVADPHVARSRTTGRRETDRADSAAPSGTGRNDSFVGRTAGGDPGDGAQTGANQRAQDVAERGPSY